VEIDRVSGTGADKPAFLRRQFSPPTTRSQTVFDVLFGVIAPILCFAFDPIVFKSADFGPPLFADFRGFAYLTSGIEVLLLAVWLLWGRGRHSPTHLLGGMLAAGAVISGFIGLVLLPFSLMGLFLGVGIFGFVPFLTALVYLRNARSAFQVTAKPASGSSSPKRNEEAISLSSLKWIGATLVGFILVVGPPASFAFAASIFVSQAMNAVLSADELQANQAIDEIQYLQIFAPPDLNRIVNAYQQTNERSRKDELRRRYLKLTGDDLEEKLKVVVD
jgi:hypothetical protein